ncbi:MAG: HAMP domain-containing histidine kinase [Cyclobacteriaceae bacterium]|nr:HAMP domain-containing histidine kinase [Cyclobacteriaceae bacterium]
MKQLIGTWADRLRLRHPEDERSFFTTRRDVLYARLVALCLVASFFTLIKDFTDQGWAPVPLAVLVIVILILIAFLLNTAGYMMASRIIFFTMLNLAITLMCSILPKERLVFVYFFPIVNMAFVVFDEQHRRHRIFFAMLSAVLLTMLVYTDFKLFWDYQISISGLGKLNMITNIVVSLLIIILCIEFLIRTNSRAEEILRRQADYINGQNAELKKINAELDRFVYSASHDLRAPLLSVQGLTNVALMESVSEKDSQYFTMIRERVVKMDNFIKDIIEYSRNTRTDLQVENIETESFIREIISSLQYLEGAHQIDFTVSASAPVIITDKSRLRIILSNIIANSIRYYNASRDNPMVAVHVGKVAEGTCITIRDNGIGISEESQPRIFDMFYRASDRSGGSGLGLYIVREMMEKMGGRVEVQSVYGEGSKFTIIFPEQTAVNG